MYARARERTGPGLLLLLGCLLVALALPTAVIGRSRLAPDVAGGALGLICTVDHSGNGVSTVDVYLEATDGRISTPDGNSLYMWGYAVEGGPFQIPGPVLCVDEGDTVKVHLKNKLTEPVSIVFPGQTGVTPSGGSAGLFTAEAAGGGTVDYTFTASEPGTYLYESGTEPHKQVHMGLYGVLVVRPAMNGTVTGTDVYAYNDAATEYSPDWEYLLVLHEIDPDLHYAVEHSLPYDVTTKHDRYWTINGRSMPDTLAFNSVPWLPHQPYSALVLVEAVDPDDIDPPKPALIRYANAGWTNHPFHPHGNNLRVIARDGRVLEGPLGEDTSFENFTTTIGSGQTYDLLFQWVAVDDWYDGGAPVPVTIPGLQNLVFKDDATFYSGSPVLGEQDELPVGLTGYNLCGEFYFPWHVHALNEFQNFDEGFGGMGTAVLVAPPSPNDCPF